MNLSLQRIARATVILIFSSTAVQAQLRLPNLFGDGMVLQQQKPIPVWGWGVPGARVEARLGAQDVSAQVDEQGTWQLEFAALEANFEGQVLAIESDGVRLSIDDILIGEVWVCGGQSNMEWKLRSTRDADVEVPSANYPAIRYLRLPKTARNTPQSDFPVKDPLRGEGHWRPCTPQYAGDCTGVGYYFGRRLRRRLNVPIGLIDISWGGTMAQHWVRPATMRPFPEMQSYIEKFEGEHRAWLEGGEESGALERYQADVKKWELELAKAKQDGTREPRKPNQATYGNPAHKGHPGAMLNGTLMPIVRANVRGVLFYQGENNSFGESWKPFHRTFPAVISDWRALFRDPELPIGILQIAGWSNRRSMTYDMNHHTNVIRELQHITWERAPHTGLIVTFDTNSNQSIHPGRKLPVGERTARWALAEVYGITSSGSNNPLEWRGPIYEGMGLAESRIVISFQPGTARGLRLDRDVEVGFYIAGADREFKHARVRVVSGEDKRSRLQVWSDEVPEPVAVRYGWSNLPAGGLMNARELPAYPFRTDDWPLTPHQSTGSYQVQR